MYRKLRIAWSVFWGVLTVMLCVMWIRSYWYTTTLFGTVGQADQATLMSVLGELRLNLHTKPDSAPSIGYDDGYPAKDYEPWNRYHFYYGDDGFFGTAVVVPFWFVTLILVSVSAAPWIRWRFSLRTLLIAMALVAGGLGLLIWMLK
jgi:hypothetical protein